jgi:hypothetical protein
MIAGKAVELSEMREELAALKLEIKELQRDIASARQTAEDALGVAREAEAVMQAVCKAKTIAKINPQIIAK